MLEWIFSILELWNLYCEDDVGKCGNLTFYKRGKRRNSPNCHSDRGFKKTFVNLKFLFLDKGSL